MAKDEAKAANANPAEHGQLQDVALAIFSEATRTSRGYDPGKVALDSFRKAKAFLDVSAAIFAGELSAEAEASLPYEEIEVPRMIQHSDEKWETLTDERTGAVLTEKVGVDRFAYAPNLPADHPINLRFKPTDGRSIKERHLPERLLAASAN